MIRLIGNENMKIYRRPRTWVLVALQVIAIVLPLFFVQFGGGSEDWRPTLIEENRISQESLKNSASLLDEHAIRQIEDAIRINEYRLEHGISPMASMWSVVSEWMFVLQITALLVVIIASDIVASEFTWGTVKLLLIRPVSRNKILFAKYAAVLIFAAFMLALAFVGPALIGAFVHGFGGSGDVYLSVKDGVVQESSMALHVLGVYLLKSVNLLMIATLAFMLSAVFRSSSLAIALSILFLFLGTPLTMVLSNYEWAKYILFANTDLTLYLDGNAPMPGMTLGFSIAVLVGYYLMFHIVSCGVFSKRDVRV